MKRLYIILLLLITSNQFFGKTETDSLLHVLDSIIEERSTYDAMKQKHIDELKKELLYATDDKELYNIYRSLFGEYRSYRMDSALWVANQRLAIAERLGEPGSINSSSINVAEILAGGGMYKEALDILEVVGKRGVDNIRKPYYYHIYHSTYTLMAGYAFSEKEKKYYRQKTNEYKDSLLSINLPESLNYKIIAGDKLIFNGKYNEALPILTECFLESEEAGHNPAMAAHGLAEIYHYQGIREMEKKYLAISAITDLKASVKEYMSLWKLATLLFEEGDIDRAYIYIKCSIEDAIFCNARYRAMEISEMLPIISEAYEIKMKQERDRIFISFLLISALSCILLCSIFYIRKKLKDLLLARKSTKQLNEELQRMNNDLNLLNQKLIESTHVKEEYIGYVFNMCSNYIDKLEDFRKTLNRKVKAGQIDDLYKLTNSTSLVADELKDFFQSFDAIFLNLYPNFIEEFNLLLQESARIVPKDGELLTPELRIFALVRLGINDSIKIASFLHYSPQTVYNYRLKIRSKAFASKEDFLNAVQQIG